MPIKTSGRVREGMGVREGKEEREVTAESKRRDR